jgi:hypothetical protein
MEKGERRTVSPKRSKPALVVVAAGEHDRLRELQQLYAPSLAEMLLAAPPRREP